MNTLPVNREKGAVLFVALIMLVLITLLAVSGIRMATSHLQVVANQKFTDEGRAAAEFALDSVVNMASFQTICPDGTTTFPCTTPVSFKQSDSSSDTTAINVQTTQPVCTRARKIKQTELVTTVSGAATIAAADIPCFAGLGSGGLTVVTLGSSSTSGDSLCSSAMYNITATVADATTGAAVVVDQGISTRVDSATASTACGTP